MGGHQLEVFATAVQHVCLQELLYIYTVNTSVHQVGVVWYCRFDVVWYGAMLVGCGTCLCV